MCPKTNAILLFVGEVLGGVNDDLAVNAADLLGEGVVLNAAI
jgi:hypothetical protein